VKYLARKKNMYVNSKISKRFLLEQDFDIFHPTYYDPYFLNYIGEKPFVLTIYDMIHEIFPEFYPLNEQTIVWKRTLAERAARIIAISENTKKDLINILNINPNKIKVIYLGSSLLTDGYDQSINNIVSLPQNYILFVGSRNLYKNFYFFLESIMPLLKRNRDLHLVCAGGGPFSIGETRFIKNLNVEGSVIQYPVDDKLLTYLYKKASLCVFPSIYEGFGLPILEAYSCGCPIALSRSSSLPEIGGDAAVYFDPKDAAGMREAVEEIIGSKSLKEDLKFKGFKQLKKFSWEKTAQETGSLYKELIEGS
jgi:glycosyltransferase involved in cell wall biosynthesis